MRRIGFTASTRLLVTRVHGRSHVTPLPWYALWHVGRAAAPRNTRGDGGLGWLGPQRPRSLCAAAAAAAAAGAGAGAEPDSSCTKFVEYKNEVGTLKKRLVLGLEGVAGQCSQGERRHRWIAMRSRSSSWAPGA
jgi:hypothetical protein